MIAQTSARIYGIIQRQRCRKAYRSTRGPLLSPLRNSALINRSSLVAHAPYCLITVATAQIPGARFIRPTRERERGERDVDGRYLSSSRGRRFRRREPRQSGALMPINYVPGSPRMPYGPPAASLMPGWRSLGSQGGPLSTRQHSAAGLRVLVIDSRSVIRSVRSIACRQGPNVVVVVVDVVDGSGLAATITTTTAACHHRLPAVISASDTSAELDGRERGLEAEKDQLSHLGMCARARTHTLSPR